MRIVVVLFPMFRADRGELIEELNMGENGVLKVAGFAAYSLDVLDAILENLPIAISFILIATIVLIFIQVRSIVIPIKAIVMNILSISASFGMLVFVFQWGYGADLLNFTSTDRNNQPNYFVLHSIWIVNGLRSINAI